MKKASRFLAEHASNLDSGAAAIFRLTVIAVSLALLLSLVLLATASLFSNSISALQLADGLFHSVFRMAAVGFSAGFAADIAAKRR